VSEESLPGSVGPLLCQALTRVPEDAGQPRDRVLEIRNFYARSGRVFPTDEQILYALTGEWSAPPETEKFWPQSCFL